MPGNTDTSRPSIQSYETPQALVDLIAYKLDLSFSVDLCGTHANKKAPQVISQDDDGVDSLAEAWEEWLTTFPGAGWVNPPYSNPECGRFVTKARATQAAEYPWDVVCLVPASICTKWWLENGIPKYAAIYPLFPRVPFVGMSQGIDRDLVILHFGSLTPGLKDPIYWLRELKELGQPIDWLGPKPPKKPKRGKLTDGKEDTD